MAEAGQHTQDYEKALHELGDVDQKMQEAHAYAKELIAEAKKIVAEAPEDLSTVMEVNRV
jgi:hypothetical protein